MQMTFVKYRTKHEEQLCSSDNWWSEYVVLPTIWLSDLLMWLSDIGADVVETTDNYDHAPVLPINWPSYETCRHCIMVSDAFNYVL